MADSAAPADKREGFKSGFGGDRGGRGGRGDRGGRGGRGAVEAVVDAVVPAVVVERMNRKDGHQSLNWVDSLRRERSLLWKRSTCFLCQSKNAKSLIDSSIHQY